MKSTLEIKYGIELIEELDCFCVNDTNLKTVLTYPKNAIGLFKARKKFKKIHMRLLNEWKIKAYEYGKSSFIDNKPCVPACDVRMNKFWSKCQLGESIPLSKAWLIGWHDMNLKSSSDDLFKLDSIADNCSDKEVIDKLNSGKC